MISTASEFIDTTVPYLRTAINASSILTLQRLKNLLVCLDVPISKLIVRFLGFVVYYFILIKQLHNYTKYNRLQNCYLSILISNVIIVLILFEIFVN